MLGWPHVAARRTRRWSPSWSGCDGDLVTGEDLTSAERRLVLGALWNHRDALGRSFDDVGWIEDVTMHEIDTMTILDSAAVKLGGDPAKDLYGAGDW